MTALTIEQVAKSTLEVAESGGPILSRVAKYMDAAEKLKERTNTHYKNNNLYVLWRKFGVIHILNKKNPAIFCGVCLS